MVLIWQRNVIYVGERRAHLLLILNRRNLALHMGNIGIPEQGIPINFVLIWHREGVLACKVEPDVLVTKYEITELCRKGINENEFLYNIQIYSKTGYTHISCIVLFISIHIFSTLATINTRHRIMRMEMVFRTYLAQAIC